MTGEEPTTTTTNGVAAEASPPAEEVPLLIESQKSETVESETLSPNYKEVVRKEVLDVLNHLNIIKDNGESELRRSVSPPIANNTKSLPCIHAVITIRFGFHQA